jgi:hypothetical protein
MLPSHERRLRERIAPDGATGRGPRVGRSVRRALAAALLIGCGAGESDASPLVKSEWTVARAACPIGCSDAVIEFITQLAGEPVEISPTTFNAPFLDPCEGTVGIDFQRRPVSALLDEVNGARPPGGRSVDAVSLGLSGDLVTSGVVYCTAGGDRLPVARLLSVETGRILVLFEETSVIELR